jgi:hypothetical protein
MAKRNCATEKSVDFVSQLPHSIATQAQPSCAQQQKDISCDLRSLQQRRCGMRASNPKALFIPEYLTYLLEICGSEKDAASIMNS